ncbi:MAG: TrkA C-terminal domain-containing protein [Nitrospira sp.]|nr:TrkA C-terminal domain-containing protein [Nitrospira sp.]MBH0182646.1 TrkA C-terminal domain-containing protein [Nitrospira sp.]MBH0184764.1 TrkA C-terminal domain-containing protein [Nitrospira sp.]
MSLEFFGRLHKELSITGSALYEIVLSISERVNRKTQIIRLHWHASGVLQRIDEVTAEVGRQVVDHTGRPFSNQNQHDSTMDTTVSHAAARVQELKRSLTRIDGQIRELKLEAIHEDSLKLQQDLAVRSAKIERLTITRHAAAVGQTISAMPRSSSIHIVSVLRGPFLLAPSEGLIFRSDDIVVLIGIESELDRLVTWFTSQRTLNAATTKSA